MIQYRPIGLIHSPFADVGGMPIQPTGDSAARGEVEIYPEFADGLRDIEGFSHLILLYHFHRVGPPKLRVIPYMDTKEHGAPPAAPPGRTLSAYRWCA